ncbi:MAG: hypothetical protein GX095_05370 [Clostridiales bacterium]|nr:hypothetical protein [Clostridiales bacterium]
MVTKTFTVPDYYTDFACKRGECRHTCCCGWGVSLSMSEYFRLLGLNCSKKLRKKLDVSFYIAENPHPQRYAVFKKTGEGDCPLRQKDGLCGLHKECGEEVLPGICRYYPRAPRGGYAFECSCSGSCEKVIELLMARKDKIGLKEVTLTFDLSTVPPLISDENTREIYKKTRIDCLSIIQDRDYPLPVRIRRIGEYLKSLGGGPAPDESGRDFAKEFETAKAAFMRIEESSVSLGGYAAVVEDVFADINAYPEVKARFEALFPDWEIMLENLMVNHIFYEKFPFSDCYSNFSEAFYSLCGAYTFLRYMGMGYTYRYPSTDALADVWASALRVIEHSGFDRNIAYLFKRGGVNSFASLAALLNI